MKKNLRKRDLSILTPKIKSSLKKWLAQEANPDSCPFNDYSDNCEICYALFPKLEFDTCPCEQFDRKYVIKVAKELVK